MSIFYKITAPNGKVSYLFGTIHQNDTASVTLPLEVKKALEQATDCVFEMDMSALMEDPSIMFLLATSWKGSQIQYRHRIPEGYISNTKRHFKKICADGIEKHPYLTIFLQDIERESVERVPPIVVAMDMNSPTDKKELSNPLDKQLMSYAKVKSKKISYLESSKEQLTAFYGYNFNILEQIELYHYFIESERLKEKKALTPKEIKNAYQQQDIQKIHDLCQRTGDAPNIVHRYDAQLLTDRDLIMAERMKPYLDNGNGFIAVGAFHLKGITHRLQADGYTIEAIPLGKRHYPIEGTMEDGEKVAAFRKIYTALYLSQTSFFKKRGFLPTDDRVVSLKEIQDYLHTNKDTRSSKAWELANRHYKNISSGNTELLKSICQEGYTKSSSFFGLFRRTKTNLDDAQSVQSASPETRTGTVRDILNGAPI